MQCFAIPESILNEIEGLCRNFFWGQRREERKTAWVAWDKLYGAKKEGGMGMRNMSVFNKALVAKQAWRLVNYRTSFVARVLKQKYFPHSSFLDIKASPVATFSWKSILSGRDLLKRGLKKVVGGGHTIDVWADPWVPNLPNFRIFSSASEAMEKPRYVADLIDGGKWNLQLLQVWFTEWEVDAITRIPIPIFPCADGWAWHHSKTGNYTM